ncbi:MAG: sensor histidine kinase [Firmicutes bacterium]|nr:sensor histidine kinase [Bacillota bacterium]
MPESAADPAVPLSPAAAILLRLASYGTVTVAMAGYLASIPPSPFWRWGLLGAIFLVYYGFQIVLNRSNWWQKTLARVWVFLGVQTTLAVALAWGFEGPGFAWFILLHFMLASQAFFLLPPSRALAAVGLIYAACMVAFYGLIRPASWQDLLGLAGALLAGFAFAAAMSYLAIQQFRERQRAEVALAELRLSQARLEEAHRRLAAYARQVEELAATRERNRLAREIHDTLAHSLTALVIQLEGCDRLWPTDPARAHAYVARALELARGGLSEVRRSLRALHTELAGQRSCSEALGKLAEEFQRDTGLDVAFRVSGQERPIRPERFFALYRALQEALTNAGRHGRARRVTADLLFLPGEVRLAVSDDGQGAAQVVPGLGLTGMKERVQELQGSLQISTRPGEGFTLIITLPEE